MTTALQTRSNRQNALKSTGPRTDEGKAASRGNALKHGLAGAGLVLPDAEADEVRSRSASWAATLRPNGAGEEWLAEQVATESVRVECCQRQERALLGRQSARAALNWEGDRALDAEELATGLSRRPSLVRRRLEQTAQGCDWLIDRWRRLAVRLDGGGWDERCRSLALDLLGTPAELRDGRTPVDPAPGSGADPTEARRAVAAAEVARLSRLKADVLDDLDADRRDATAAGLGDPDRALNLIRRYEAACFRRMQWALARLAGAHRPPAARVAHKPAPAPAPTRGAVQTFRASACGLGPPAARAEPAAGPRPDPDTDPAPSILPGNRRWRRAQSRQARLDAR